jgi:uncharacterized membrane protein YbhN (UPF0104 family)
MTPPLRRWLISLLKLALALVILFFVFRLFQGDLPRLGEVDWKPGWILLSIALYLVALGFSCGFWMRLLVLFGQKPSVFGTLRAYYVGHLGKYVPGKAVSLLMRAGLTRGPGVSMGVAALTSLYEVLTTMASGALVAALVFAMDPPTIKGMTLPPYVTGLLLLAVCGVPLLPGVFNRLVSRSARRFQSFGALQVPPMQFSSLLQGLALTMCGWSLLGLSTWAGLNAVLTETLPLNATTWLRLSAITAMAWVGGFLFLFMPGGLGVREALLLELLGSFDRPDGEIKIAIILMRVAWTSAELVMAAAVYWIRPRQAPG